MNLPLPSILSSILEHVGLIIVVKRYSSAHPRRTKRSALSMTNMVSYNLITSLKCVKARLLIALDRATRGINKMAVAYGTQK